MEKLKFKEFYEILSEAHRKFIGELEHTYKDYSQYLSTEYSAVKKKYYKTILDKIIQERYSTLLDIGCSSGSDLTYFSKRQRFFACGIDISLNHLKKAILNDFSNNKVNFIQAHAQELPFKDATFDLVISSEVIEHLPQPELCFCEMYRITKSNGFLVLTTPNRYSYFTLIGKIFPSVLRKKIGRLIRGIPNQLDIYKETSHFNIQRHIHEFSPFELKRILNQAGFKVEKIQGGMLAIPFIFLFYKFSPLYHFWFFLDKLIDLLPFSFYLKANFLISARKL